MASPACCCCCCRRCSGCTSALPTPPAPAPGPPLQLRLLSFQSLAALLRGCLSEPSARLASEVLRQQAVAPVVGVLMQSCLEAADQEVAAGAGGSKALRAAALEALQLTIQAVGSPQVLAFFLPGGRPGVAGGGVGGWVGGGRGGSAAHGERWPRHEPARCAGEALALPGHAHALHAA